ncbi:hypothetical protein HIM_04187 [Hirsutella minnesotensis 3608]|uniref:Protein kinase domain-containing protein n=1 Tax=Hirsutella minnesotensis 3608 TaxID=1043627 RepID=A0A0F7ZVE2_9HYPO|nr:hypothetical protein HIM_04187 [Hirsutella minnesotensis 3608]
MAYKPQYHWIDGAENLDKYPEGGYHPIEIGNILHDRYHIVDKLGCGGWSTVWLALDGPNGSHPCYATEPALCTLQESAFSRLFPLDVSRALAYELALAVAYIHSHGYAHGVAADIYLQNVLVKASSTLNQLSIEQFRERFGKPDIYFVERLDGNPLHVPPSIPRAVVVSRSLGKRANDFTLSDARLLLSDFGEAFIPSAQSRLGADCHSPVDFRPPDAFFQPDIPLSFSADIWCLALAIWDILGMQPLFSSAFGSLDTIISQVVDVFGPLPSDWWEKWEGRAKYFNDDGTPKARREVWPKLEQAFEECVQKFRRQHNVGEYGQDERVAILDLVGRMLKLKPQERITIDEVLQCEWMTKWARPDYERSLAASLGT